MARTANATYPMKLACLIWLAAESGHPFLCAECGKPILPGQAVQFDHRHAVGRGGQNRVEDLRPVHAAKRGTEDAAGNPLDCHDRKTNRPRSLATTIGGDTFEYAKTNRLVEQQAAAPDLKRAWPSRPMQSRGFQPAPPGHSSWPKRRAREAT